MGRHAHRSGGAGSVSRALVSIDPGLDRAAAALWDLDGWVRGPGAPVSVSEGARRLAGVYQSVTSAKSAMPDRLSQLTEWAHHLSNEVRGLLDVPQHVALAVVPCAVVVEWPAFAGLYAGRTEGRSRRVMPNAGAMAGLYAATGAIVAGVSHWCDPARIELRPASRVGRDIKQRLARQVIDASALAGRVASNDDTRSAVFIGLSAEWAA